MSRRPGQPAAVAAGEETADPRSGEWWCPHCERQVPGGEARLMKSGRLRCPDCGRRLVSGEHLSPAQAAAGDGHEEEERRAPWHFKLLAIGTVGYLIYRLIWFIFWLTGHAWHG